MILNLIFGLLITLILAIIYIINACLEGTMRSGSKSGGGSGSGGAGNMSSALDFMSGVLDGSVESTSGGSYNRENGKRLHKDRTTRLAYQNTHSARPLDPSQLDFPIDDPDIKEAFTASFIEIYGREERPPPMKYEDIDGRMKYNESLDNSIYTAAYHNGQRKLIGNEIEFLSSLPLKPALVVYAGAAPSNKGAFEASLFPHLKFLLIDPAKFDIRPYRGVTIEHLDIKDGAGARELISAALKAFRTADVCTARVFMTGEIAAEIRRVFDEGEGKSSGKDGSTVGTELAGPYFISDIRTNMITDGPTTLDIMWNSAQHIQWVILMRPVKSMLKFRLPFYSESEVELQKYEEMSHAQPYADAFDFAASIVGAKVDADGADTIGVNMRIFKPQRKIPFFDGTLYIQPWAPISSTEARLVFDGVPKMREYDRTEYEERFFYYNKLLRNYQMYSNPNASREIGFDHCADCAIENQIWTEYCVSRGIPEHQQRDEIHHYVQALSEITYRPLLRGHHGRMFGPIPMQLLMKRFSEYTRKGGDE